MFRVTPSDGMKQPKTQPIGGRPNIVNQIWLKKLCLAQWGIHHRKLPKRLYLRYWRLGWGDQTQKQLFKICSTFPLSTKSGQFGVSFPVSREFKRLWKFFFLSSLWRISYPTQCLAQAPHPHQSSGIKPSPIILPNGLTQSLMQYPTRFSTPKKLLPWLLPHLTSLKSSDRIFPNSCQIIVMKLTKSCNNERIRIDRKSCVHYRENSGYSDQR